MYCVLYSSWSKLQSSCRIHAAARESQICNKLLFVVWTVWLIHSSLYNTIDKKTGSEIYQFSVIANVGM